MPIASGLRRKPVDLESSAGAPEEDWGILSAVAPMARPALSAVREATLVVAPADQAPALAGSLEQSLHARLLEASGMLFAVEIGAASTQGLLAGDTPEARFEFFCRCLKERVFARALLARYPVLSRRLRMVVGNWRAATLEMLARLHANRSAIARAIFGADDIGALVGAVPLGDSHCGGRRVHRLEFASGRKLIYKPRPVAMEHGGSAFIRWASSRGLAPDMIAPIVIDSGEYGWVEFLDGAACSPEGGKRFFRRQGANLMIAHLLGATDLHFENLIAVGEHPVIVDWETLFNPAPKHRLRGASAAAADAIHNSLMRTLLLPTRVSGAAAPEETPRSADISALGYIDHQDAPFPSLWWERFGTDAVHLRRHFGVLPAAECLPLVDGARVPARAHTREIIEGFEGAYRFFERRRRALSDASGPLARFRGAVQRQVLRPTAFYVQLLGESWHPRFAQDASLLTTHLRSCLEAQGQVDRRTQRSEVRQLLAGDVPYYGARVGRAQLDPRGAAPPTHGDGWRACATRIASLGVADRERQAWMIALSMADLSQPVTRPATRPATMTRRQMLALAHAYGDRLHETAIVRGARATWLVPLIDDQRLSPAGAGFGLYHGLAGIALFLARLSLVGGRPRYRQLALMAAAEGAALHDPSTLAVGYEGAGGLAYSLALLSLWLDKPRLLGRSKAIVRDAVRTAGGSTEFMSGASGLLAAACAVAEISSDRGLLDLLSSLAHEIGASAPPPDSDTGLAHGKAGVGFALARWGNAVGDKGAFAAGRNLLETDVRYAWRSRSSGDDGGASMLAWCRGELGAAWADLYSTRRSRSAARVVEALVAREPNEAPMCPCHGLLGQIDFLIEARKSGVPGAREALNTLSRRAFSRLVAGEACSDHAHTIETPGLLMGLAGSGYTLLRLLNSNGTPSPLMLQPIA